MLEPAVALSDFALATECLIFAALLRQRRTPGNLPPLFIALFLTIAAASFVGALVHGWFPDQTTTAYRILWPASMLAVGATGAILWMIGILLLDSKIRIELATRALVALWAGYALIVIFFDQKFYVALAAYLPGTIFLGVIFLKRYLAERSTTDRWGFVGIILSLAAGAVQYFAIDPYPR